MESIRKNDVLQFNENALQELRKQYNLETPERINQAIDIIENWLKKQEHFLKRDISRENLETLIILSKGSVEKVKKKLDLLCTFRTLLPNYFEMYDAGRLRSSNTFKVALLPKMTPDHYRVLIVKVSGKMSDLSELANLYKYLMALCEYMHTYDYCCGLVVTIDYMDASLLDVAKNLDVIELHKILKIMMDGYGLRFKGIHTISASKLINIMASIFKQAVRGKIKERIYPHNSCDTLYDHVPRDILPIEYGGNEKPLVKLQDVLLNAMASEEFGQHLREMSGAVVDERQRRTDTFNDEFMGMPGTFRSLCLD